MDNYVIAHQLMQMAHQLERERGNLYRIRAYRTAAATVQGLDRAVTEILQEDGVARLRDLPGIGSHIAGKIATLVHAAEFANVNAHEELAAVG